MEVFAKFGNNLATSPSLHLTMGGGEVEFLHSCSMSSSPTWLNIYICINICIYIHIYKISLLILNLDSWSNEWPPSTTCVLWQRLFRRLNPLGQVGHRVAMSVCLSQKLLLSIMAKCSELSGSKYSKSKLHERFKSNDNLSTFFENK